MLHGTLLDFTRPKSRFMQQILNMITDVEENKIYFSQIVF